MNSVYKFLVNIVHSALEKIKQKPYHLIAFITVWYYVELLYMMNIALFFYPPMLISLIGIILGIVLSIHIIKLYIGNYVSMAIQLFIFDIHIAYSIGITVSAYISTTNIYEMMIIIIRDIIAICELILIYIITSNE